MAFLKFALVIVAFLTSTSEGARILALEPMPGKSHMVLFSALTRELARRGHELVVVSSFPLSKPMPNYTDIDVSADMQVVRDQVMGEKMYDMAEFSPWQSAIMLWDMGIHVTETIFEAPKVKEILNDKRGFDLVLVELFLNEAVYGFAHYFNAPLVLFCPFGGFPWVNAMHGNPAPLSYVPNTILPFPDKMTFTERLINAVVTTVLDMGYNYYYMPRQDTLLRKMFGDSTPTVWDLQRSTSLTLLNNHVSLSYPRPLVPNMIEVGGVHVSRTVNKLPTDIQKFLDEAPEGAIFFSMGSNLRSDQMPAERRDAFMAAFKELPQRVLWKWESDSLPGQPSNVKLGKWLPQQDILAHPKVRLFITHGGLLSAQEAAFHGVPLVGIPVFGDQSLNMRKAVLGGFGAMVELKNVTKQSILGAINKVLYDPSYRHEAQRRMAVYRDQPETPLERAVFWTEYVMRHQGAPHLRSAATQLAWYQIHLLDVAALVLGVLVMAWLALRALLKLCCGGTKNKRPTVNKRKKKE